MRRSQVRALPDHIEVQGNNDGSYVRLAKTDKEGICVLEVGETCVVTVRQEIPVVWLAIVLTKAHNDGFENVCRAYGIDEKFLQEVR